MYIYVHVCICGLVETGIFSFESNGGGVRVFSFRHLFIIAYSLLCCSNSM